MSNSTETPWSVVPLGKTAFDLIHSKHKKYKKFALMYLADDPQYENIDPKALIQLRCYHEQPFLDAVCNDITPDEVYRTVPKLGVVNTELVYYKFAPLKNILAREWDFSFYSNPTELSDLYGMFTFEHCFAEEAQQITINTQESYVHFLCLKALNPTLKALNDNYTNE